MTLQRRTSCPPPYWRPPCWRLRQPEPGGYAAEKPVLDLARYFNGTIDATASFRTAAARSSRFTVVMQCPLGGHQGVLDEAFTYSDGSTQRRIWRLTRHADGRYTGTADDVVGQATGQTQGNAFAGNTPLALPVDGRIFHVDLDDWMYLIDERVMLNRARRANGASPGRDHLAFTWRSA